MKIEKANFNFIDMHNMYTCTNVKIQKEMLKIWFKQPNLIHALIFKVHFLKVLHQTKKTKMTKKKPKFIPKTCLKSKHAQRFINIIRKLKYIFQNPDVN
jgi:hypothetical protein